MFDLKPGSGYCISIYGYYIENNSAFLDYHLKPLAKTVKSFIKDTNHFLQKLKGLPKLSRNSLLCTIDVVNGLYPNIPHNEGLEAVRKNLTNGKTKKSQLNLWLNLLNVF